ncbi:MAG: CHAD domain-containing protein [Parvularculaceae bacterium]
MAHPNIEFELKLIGPAGDIARLAESPIVKKAMVGAGEYERVTSIYLDSADRRLMTAGLSLRLRDEPDSKKLIVKLRERSVDNVARIEIERRFHGRDESFATGVADIDRIIGAETDDIAPIARTVADRWAALLDWRGAIIEASSELGRVERLGGPDGAENAAAPLAEIEIELLKGDAANVFDLVRQLMAESGFRFRVTTESKLERALRAGGPAIRKKLARPAAEGASSAELLSASLRVSATEALAAAEMMVDYQDEDAARRFRVSLRRFRAVECAFRRAHQSDWLKSLARDARDLARLVGAARDLDLFMTKTLPGAEASGAVEGVALLREKVERDRAEAWRRVVIALTGETYSAFSVEFLRAGYAEPWRADAPGRLLAPARLYADILLDNRWRKLSAFASELDFSDIEGLHRLRIQLKKFRYAAQVFRDLYPREERKPFFKSMSALQQKLGELNDASVASRTASHLAEGLGPQAARAAGFIAGAKSVEASIAAEAVSDLWSALTEFTPYWLVESPPVIEP